MVGFYIDSAGRSHGFLLDPNGAFTTIDVQGATVTVLVGIDNRGEIVGGQSDDV
jgi:hypothetical protein